MKNRRLLLYVILVMMMLTLILVGVMHHILWPHFLLRNEPLHSAMESVGALAALLMAILLLQRQPDEGDGRLFWVAMGLLGGGILDVFHAASQPGQGFVLLHSTAVLVGGLGFALIWLPESYRYTFMRRWIPWTVIIGAALFGIWTFLPRGTLPLMVQDGEFTTTARVLNLLSGVLFVIAAGHFLIDFHRSSKLEPYLFSCMALLFGLSSLTFTYSALWGDTWWFWHLLRLSAYFIVLGVVIHGYRQTALSLRDEITERKQAEEQLRESEERYRSLVTSALVGVYQTRTDGTIRFVNEALVRMLEFDSAEQLSRSTAWMMYKDPSRRQEMLRLLRESGQLSSFELTLITHRANELHVLVSAVLTDDVLRGVVVDITQRKRAEEELRRVNRALRTLSGCNQILVRATDEAELLQGICKTIVDLGGYRLAWVGFAGQDEAKSVRPVAQAGYEEGYLDTVNITWADTERGRGPTGSAIRSGQPSIMRSMLTGPDYAPWRSEATRRGFASSIALPLTASGGTFGALNIYASDPDAFDEEEVKLLMELAADLAYGIGALRTRAEREQAEKALLESSRRLEETLAELRRAQQQVIQQQRLQALGEMASGIAHDFNNVLTPILGYTDLLLSRPEGLADRQRVVEYLGTMNTAARDAANMVGRLREFYRYREETESFQPLNLNQVVEQAVSLTEPRWKSQALSGGIVINIETDLRELPSVAGSESELRSVLTNLIFNAVEAMPQGGTMTLRTYPHGEHVVLEVRDTGIGMTEEVRRRCMEPFFTTKRESGSGLGLSTVYGTVQRHEGTIDIESEVGKGTTFTIRLPAQAREKAESRGQQEVESPPHPLRILVVDDEPVVRQVIARYLLGEGHAVETAASGLEALEKFTASSFDLVMTDRAMPGMSGDQLAAAIKQTSPNMPVISLSGFGDVTQGSGEKPPGVDLILPKPVTLEELREAVARVTPQPQ